MKEFAKYFDTHKEEFLKLFRPAEDKYREIWKFYNKTMPACTMSCNKLVADKDDIEGPQGIHWIGPHTKILFVGKYNYGWTNNPNKFCKEKTFEDPVTFFYTKTSHMSHYWEKVREISTQVIGKDFEACFPIIAVTNYCKCWSALKVVQRKLNDNCWKQQFFKEEIRIINAPINVLFTRDIDSDLKGYFPEGELKIRRNNGPFSKGVFEKKLFYLYYHPVRRSNDELNELIQDLQDEYKNLS